MGGRVGVHFHLRHPDVVFVRSRLQLTAATPRTVLPAATCVIQGRHQLAADGEAMGIVLRQVLHQSGYLAVHLCTTEFRVVAATLLELKAARLLPTDEDVELDEMAVEARDLDPLHALGRARDERIQSRLDGKLRLFEGEMLHTPGTIRTQAGSPYAVFSQFARTFRKTVRIEKTLAAPAQLEPLPAAAKKAAKKR